MKRLVRNGLITVFAMILIFEFWIRSGDLNLPLLGHPATRIGNTSNVSNTSNSITLPSLDAIYLPHLPADYQDSNEPSTCTMHLGIDYLRDFSSETYCSSSKSESNLTCFHSQTDTSGRIDSFCIGEGVRLANSGKKFQVSCLGDDSLEPTDDTEKSNLKYSVPLTSIPKSWYETGPRVLLDNFIDLTIQHIKIPEDNRPEEFTVLVKREGAFNPWHSLMEIMSLSMTLDILQISSSSKRAGGAFIIPEDAPNTQVIMLDDHDDGPYFDLWRLFAKKPTIRLSALPADTYVGNIILPLPGASNPVWQNDWIANSCTNSKLLRTFAKRVSKHYEISESSAPEENNIIVTFLDRRGTRKLVDTEKHIAALSNRYAHAEVRLIDVATLPFAEQVQIVRNSDVLAGVHGAGLTHALWLKERSALVEILPKDFEHKGFRNLAGAMGVGYFSTHGLAQNTTEGAKVNWQNDDVAIEEDRFLELMDVAIKSVYNLGTHNYDVNK